MDRKGENELKTNGNLVIDYFYYSGKKINNTYTYIDVSIYDIINIYHNKSVIQITQITFLKFCRKQRKKNKKTVKTYLRRPKYGIINTI